MSDSETSEAIDEPQSTDVDSTNLQRQDSGLNRYDETRSCWVCFATDEDDPTASWVRPCRCKGTTKWVHQKCLQRWVDEKQRGNPTVQVSCSQCGTDYIIVFPAMGTLMTVLDAVDTLINRICPFVAAGVVVGCVYWTAVTYGAVTVVLVMGQRDGLTLMEESDPLFLLLGLPTIPIALILGKMIRWEDSVAKFLRVNAPKMPLLRFILPSFSSDNETTRVPAETSPLCDPMSATRVLCGALILPSVAVAAGKVLFENVQSNFKRALLGGLVFVTIKGTLKIYYKQQQWVRQAKRLILEYDERVARALQSVERPQPSQPEPVDQ